MLVGVAVFIVGLMMPFAGIINVVLAQDEAADLERSDRVLRIGFMQAVDNLNPNLGLNDASYVFYGLVYDNPHCIDGNATFVGNLCVSSVPVPATDAEMVSSGRPFGSIWEYKMSENALWHDGEPFTVDDFVWNIEIQSDELYYDAMWAFQPYTHFMESVKKIDEFTARIYYYARTNGTPIACAWGDLLGIPMLPRHKLGEMAPTDIGFAWSGVFEDEPLPIVGTGPFRVTSRILDEWRAGDRLTLVRNPDYHWGADKNMYVNFDKVEMLFYDDATSMRIALTSGDLDIAQFPPETYKAIKDGVTSGSGEYEDIAVYDGPKITQYWTEIEFNMNAAGPNPSRLDPAIRHALAMATNKSFIIQTYYRGLADEGSTLIPSINEYWHYEPTEAEKWKFDLDAARDVLEDAGYRYLVEGDATRVCTADSMAYQELGVLLNKPLKYHMLIREEYPEEKLIAQYLKATWAQVGVELEYEVMAESKMSTEVYYYTYDTCIWYWSSDVDPNYMLYCQSKLSWDGWSDNKYYNEYYEENYSASVSAMDPEQRRDYVQNCQKIHYQDCAFIIMANVYQTYAWRTDTFENWGDWDAMPGISMDNFWTGNYLWYQLEYIGGGGGGFDWVSATIAGVAIVAVIVGIIMLMRRKRKSEGIEERPLGQ